MAYNNEHFFALNLPLKFFIAELLFDVGKSLKFMFEQLKVF